MNQGMKMGKRDVPIILLSGLGGFLLPLIALAGQSLGTALFVGLIAGAPCGIGGAALACIIRRRFKE